MRDNLGVITPRERDRLRVDVAQLGEPPILHLDDEYADVRKDGDEIRIAPSHHRLVVDENPVNIAVATAGIARTIAGWVPNFAAIAPVLATSDLLATVPSLAMANMHHRYSLGSRHVPFPIAPMPHAMLWSAGRSHDPEIRWLRDRLAPIVKSEFAGLRLGDAQVKSPTGQRTA